MDASATTEVDNLKPTDAKDLAAAIVEASKAASVKRDAATAAGYKAVSKNKSAVAAKAVDKKMTA